MPDKNENVNPDINLTDARNRVLGWLVLCARMRNIYQVRQVPNFHYLYTHLPINIENVKGYRLQTFEQELILKSQKAFAIKYMAVRYLRAEYRNKMLRTMISEVFLPYENELISVGKMNCIVVAQNRNPNPLISTPILIPMGRVIQKK